MERHEQVLSEIRARGKGDTIIGDLPYELRKKLKG